MHSAGCEGVNQSFWAVQCLAQYVCLLCQHCTRFLLPPPIFKFIWRQLQEGRWQLFAVNSVLTILKDATGFLQTNFEERGMLLKTNKGTKRKSWEKLLICILELWKKRFITRRWVLKQSGNKDVPPLVQSGHFSELWQKLMLVLSRGEQVFLLSSAWCWH